MYFHIERYYLVLIMLHEHMILIEHIHHLEGIYRIVRLFSQYLPFNMSLYGRLITYNGRLGGKSSIAQLNKLKNTEISSALVSRSKKKSLLELRSENISTAYLCGNSDLTSCFNFCHDGKCIRQPDITVIQRMIILTVMTLS